MKILYTKSNKQRKSKYQITTKIIEENNKIFVSKLADCIEAKEHLNTIYNNYKLLKERFSINLVKPTIEKETLVFDYLQYQTLEDLLKNHFENNDTAAIEVLIEKYITFIENMVEKKDVYFQPSAKFIEIFGEVKIKNKIDTISLANIDMIFANIMVDSNGDFIVIDYEWVYDFEVPKEYLLARAFIEFSSIYNLNIKEYIPIYKELEKTFFTMEKKFQKNILNHDSEYIDKYNTQKNYTTLCKKVQQHEQIVQSLTQEIETLKHQNQELKKIAQSLRIKNRIKRIFTSFKKN